jgi:hypothetical protein
VLCFTKGRPLELDSPSRFARRPGKIRQCSNGTNRTATGSVLIRPNVPVFVTSLDQTELRIYWGFPTFQRSTYRIMDKIRYVSQRVNGAKRRLDAAQERGEIRTSGDKAFAPGKSFLVPEIIPPNEIHEARIIRDVGSRRARHSSVARSMKGLPMKRVHIRAVPLSGVCALLRIPFGRRGRVARAKLALRIPACPRIPGPISTAAEGPISAI